MKQGPTGRILVIGDDMRIFLAVARALGRAGKTVEAAPFGPSPALSSRYVAKTHVLPVFDEDPAGWRAGVLDVLTRNRYDLVIPCSDPAISFLDTHRDQLPQHRLAIPPRAAMTAFYDKEETRAMADRLGVPVTPGRRLSPNDTAQSLISDYGLPIVLKPRRTFFAERDQAREIVEILDTRAELEQALSRIDDRSRYLIEAYFEGEGVGVSVLSENGTIIQAFQHRRLREGRAGVSSLRISETPDAALLEAAVKISRDMQHTGVCMFEFRQNRATGQWILIETNARFWGSMGLPVAIGVDFPGMLYELMAEGRTPAARAYRSGVRSRNLLLDAFNLVKAMRGMTPARLLPWCADAADFMLQPLRWISGSERSDSIVADDLRPALQEFTAAFGKLARLAGLGPRRKAVIGAAAPAALRRDAL